MLTHGDGSAQDGDSSARECEDSGESDRSMSSLHQREGLCGSVSEQLGLLGGLLASHTLPSRRNHIRAPHQSLPEGPDYVLHSISFACNSGLGKNLEMPQ